MPVSKKFEEISIVEKTVVVNRSRTSSETVDKKSDAVVENVVVSLSETPPAPSVVTQDAAAVAASAPVKIHSVNSNNVKTSEANSQPPTVAASSPPAESVTTDSKAPSRATPPTGSLDYEPVSPTPFAETPKSNNDEGTFLTTFASGRFLFLTVILYGQTQFYNCLLTCRLLYELILHVCIYFLIIKSIL